MSEPLEEEDAGPARPASPRKRSGRRSAKSSRGAPTSEPTAEPVKPCLVLGYDRNQSSRRAVAWAVDALLPEGMLVLVHACRPLHAPPSPISTADERRRLGQALIDELLLEGADSMFDLEIRTEVSDEDPVKALTDAARRHHARAIVVGHEAHSRLHRTLGTVTSELLNASQTPVVVVPLERPADA
ncbi:MAG: universal stress protein [Solirubrobacteraceae bacterium]|jgi:nucleotide-binding universal stress UspA family protein